MKAIPETLKEELAIEFAQLKILLEAEFERQFSLSKTKELLKKLRRRVKQAKHALIIRIKMNRVALSIPQAHSRP